MPFISARAIVKSYVDAGKVLTVLRDLDIEVAQGEMVAIVGASGAGKSTLLHVLGGLDRAEQGEVVVGGSNLTTMVPAEVVAFRNAHVGFVFQFHHLLPAFSALENVAMPLLIRRLPKAEAEARAAVVLGEVGLGHRLQHTPSELSGGERQRAAIARALVTEPACVLADEPTGNLDRQTAEGVFELMLALNRSRQTSFVVVTHDPALAGRVGRILTLRDGRLQSADA